MNLVIYRIVRNELLYSKTIISILWLISVVVNIITVLGLKIEFVNDGKVLMSSIIALSGIFTWVQQAKKEKRFNSYALLPATLLEVGISRALSLLTITLTAYSAELFFGIFFPATGELQYRILMMDIWIAMATGQLILDDVGNFFSDLTPLRGFSVKVITIVLLVLLSAAGFFGALIMGFVSEKDMISPIMWNCWIVIMFSLSVIVFKTRKSYVK